MKILTIGDIVSKEGCEYLRKTLPEIKREYSVDIVIANGENSETGNGISPKSAEYILDSGVDLITLGNHSLRRREIYSYLDSNAPIIRPANYHPSAPGRGIGYIDKGRYKIAVINLQGMIYMDPILNPFDSVQALIDEANAENARAVIVDFHAEATSEKRAMGFFLDGKVSAVFGTHTHVQTSDAQILPKGTGYITDIGMTGAYYSVLGVSTECSVEKFKTGLPVKFTNPGGKCVIEGCIFDIDEKNGFTASVTPVRR